MKEIKMKGSELTFEYDAESSLFFIRDDNGNKVFFKNWQIFTKDLETFGYLAWDHHLNLDRPLGRLE